MTQLFKTKVCGITSLKDAQMCVSAGVDAIGLNFYQPSPRSISKPLAVEITKAVGAKIKLVGLFVNETPAIIHELYDAVQLDFIQLHGDEDPFDLKTLSPLPLIKAFRCQSIDPVQIFDYLTACTTFEVSLKAILLDSYQPGTYGGTGQQLDWDSLNFKNATFGGFPVILAGGLTDQNVNQAITSTQPQGVDTASGVESAPGEKDHRKVQRFIDQATLAFGSTESD